VTFKESIQKKAEEGLTATRILREIREMGYAGGRTIPILEYRLSGGSRGESAPSLSIPALGHTGESHLSQSNSRLTVLD
jgi:hypothetical protein